MLNFAEVFAPWLNNQEREEIFDEVLRHPPRMFLADELGSRSLSLSANRFNFRRAPSRSSGRPSGLSTNGSRALMARFAISEIVSLR
jgi:hypothetical protein